MDNYIPPFSITNEMLNKVSIISEKVSKLNNYAELNKQPYLRRNNKIRSIHSSLAIEDNNLTYQQVKDVINGKIVLGPQKEIQEVKNAYNAYEQISKINPYSIQELKRIHGIIGNLTIDGAGEFRKGEEGVFDGDVFIFMCPPQKQVNKLMNDLFKFINDNKNKIHPLILSSIFHYEFVFIHPFSDGNGRTVRLWQNVILYKWKKVFEYLPIESQIYKYQDDYYDAIAICHKNGNSNKFIEFMLDMINKALDEALNTISTPVTDEDIRIKKLLDVMEPNIPETSIELMNKLGIKSRKTLKNSYLSPAIKHGLIKLTIPDKPTSGNQMYYKE